MRCNFCKNEAVDSVEVENKWIDFCYQCQIEAMKGYFMSRNKTSEINIGDFITIPKLNRTGCVFDIKKSITGPESAISIMLQIDPEKESTMGYRIEDGEFEWA